MINIAEILKGCPKGTKLYSPLCGDVKILEVNLEKKYPICVIGEDESLLDFTNDGRYRSYYINGECLLFPSKDQRDWTKFKVKKERFDPHTLKPFDKILRKFNSGAHWAADLVSYVDENESIDCIGCGSTDSFIIPYNEDTKHLIGTTDDCPEYYKWWEN